MEFGNDLERLVKLPLSKAFEICRQDKSQIWICRSKLFWLRRVQERIPRIKLREVRSLFDEPFYAIQQGEIVEIPDSFQNYAERYLRTLAYLGKVYPQSEKFLSGSYCLREAIRRKRKRLFSYFQSYLWDEKIKFPANQYVDLIRYGLTNETEFLEAVGSGSPVFQIALQVQYLIGSAGVKFMMIHMNEKISNEAVETGLFLKDIYSSGWSHFKSDDTWPLTLYLKDSVLANLPEDKEHEYLLEKALADNNVELVVALLKSQKDWDMSQLSGDLFLNDPLESLERLSIPEEKILPLLEESVQDNATRCFNYLYSLLPYLEKETRFKLLRLSIISSNLPAFGKLKNPEFYLGLKRALILCKCPEIWRCFLGYFDISELPPIPESILKQLILN